MKTMIFIGAFAAIVAANAQQPAIRPLLQAAAMGKTEEIRKKLPDLLVEYPDDAGVQYLHAVILEDAVKAAPLFEKIVKNYPTSEWADDAEWRVVQYYAMKKDTARARKELTNFRSSYPQSEFLLAASDAVKFTVGLPKSAQEKAIKETAKETAVAKNDAVKNTAKTTPAAIAIANKTANKPTEKVKPAASEKAKNAQVAANKPAISGKVAEPKKAVAIAKPAETKSLETKSLETKTVVAATTTKATVSESKPSMAAAPKTAATPTEKAQSSVSAFPTAAPSIHNTSSENEEEIEAATFEKETPVASLFSLQVGSYATKEKAEQEAKEFHQKRLRAVVGEKNVQGEAKFAVFIGEYTSRAAAEKARVIVEKQCGCKPFVVTR